MPLKRGNATLTTGCWILLLFMLVFSKLKKFIAASLILPGLSLFAAQPAQASCGQSSHYGIGDNYAYKTMANGKPMNPYAMTAAHPYLRLNSHVNVTHRGKTIRVKITDRGPYAEGRILDLSYGAFSALANPSRGVINVCITST
jgi:rare lipoprotein A